MKTPPPPLTVEGCRLVLAVNRGLHRYLLNVYKHDKRRNKGHSSWAADMCRWPILVPVYSIHHTPPPNTQHASPLALTEWDNWPLFHRLSWMTVWHDFIQMPDICWQPIPVCLRHNSLPRQFRSQPQGAPSCCRLVLVVVVVWAVLRVCPKSKSPLKMPDSYKIIIDLDINYY